MRKKLLLILVASLLVGATVYGQKYNYTLSGASPGGLWSLLGIGVNSAVKESYPGSTITYQTSGGGFTNIRLLQQKKVELGIAHLSELRKASAGQVPFKAPVKNVRVLAVLYNWAPMQLILTKSFADKHGIKTMDDLVRKKAPVRMALNRRGNISALAGEELFAASGVSLADIKKWGGNVVFSASKEQGDLIRNRRIDLINNSLFVGHRSIRQIAEAVDVVLLPVSEGVIKKMGERLGAQPFTIPGGAYKWSPHNVRTVSLSATLAANADMDEKTAYNLTKAIIVNIEKIRGVHKAMKALNKKLLATQNVVPYHPGAARAYKEAGL